MRHAFKPFGSARGNRAVQAVATDAPVAVAPVAFLSDIPLQFVRTKREVITTAPPSQLPGGRVNRVPDTKPSKPAPQAPHTAPAPAPAPVRTKDTSNQPWVGWAPKPHHLSKDQLWARMCNEARVDVDAEPRLATFLHSVILSHKSLETAMAFLLANKLADNLMLGAVPLMSTIQQAYAADPGILAAGIADLNAVMDRDPACNKFTQCLLNFKGYQAIQTHRITHYLWQQGRQALALALASRASELFSVDIHPAAQLGRGVMIDHATGVTIGETAIIGDNVSLLHHVSLTGATPDRWGRRHPHIGHGVLLGAGATVLGPCKVGDGSKVGAGSVVVSDLPSHCVAVGTPARIVKKNLQQEPLRIKEMDQCLEYVLDYEI